MTARAETAARRAPGVLLVARELNTGGTERQLCEVAKALAASGTAVHVASFRSGGVRAAEMREAGIPLVEIPLRSFRSPWNVWRSIAALRRYVRANGIALVHAFDPPASMFAGMAAPLMRGVRVLTSQRGYRVNSWFERAWLRFADAAVDGIVVNCEAMRTHVVADAGVPVTRTYLSYNGLEAARFRRSQQRGPSAVPDGAVVVGTVCVLRPEKGLLTLLRAFALALRADARLFLLVVGDGPERESLEREAESLGIVGRCHFEPAAADVTPWLSRIDVFVLPSLHEAFSNSLMEAMACECACIASRVGGNVELVRDGETGLLFDVGDVAELARLIVRLSGDEQLGERLARTAAARIEADFTIEASARRFDAIYRTVLGQ